MQNARMLGNYIEHLANNKGLSISDLSQTLECSEQKVRALYKGLAFASFDQISKLASLLGATVSQLLSGDSAQYNKTVVCCMNDFDEASRREEILDLIYDYVDIVDAVEMNQ